MMKINNWSDVINSLDVIARQSESIAGYDGIMADTWVTYEN